MSRRRPSQALKQELSRPNSSHGLFVRTLLWAFRSNVSSGLAIGILFAVGTGLRYLIPPGAQDARTVVVLVFVLLIFGVFLGVIVVTEDNKSFTHSGSRIRMTCGAIAGAAIATIFASPLEAILFATLLGVVLGYMGILWAKYL